MQAELNNETILLIEDDPLAVKMGEIILNRAGYQVLSAMNGFVGLKLARENNPDLILLDLMLPGMDGFEILSQLRANQQTAAIPVLILSAKSREEDRQMANRIGANGYMTKPYHRSELLDQIHFLLKEKFRQSMSGMEEDEINQLRGTCVAFVSPQGREATSVALQIGIALSKQQTAVTAVDFRPFSIEHAMILNLPPGSEPISTAMLNSPDQLQDMVVGHPDGLRLLHNLDGRGSAGQLTQMDVETILDMLLLEEGVVLADVPLYPADVFGRIAERCALVLLVIPSDPIVMRTAQTTYKLIQRAGVEADHIRFIILGDLSEQEKSRLGSLILASIPLGSDAAAPAYQELAHRLHALRPSPLTGADK